MSKLTLAAVALLAVGGIASAQSITSGPQAGQKVPGPFKPLHVNGPDAGMRECLYCKFGPRPVVMIFARETSPALAALVKGSDARSIDRLELRRRSEDLVLALAAAAPALGLQKPALGD